MCTHDFSSEDASPEGFMRHAIKLSIDTMEKGLGGPFGAVVVKDCVVIAEGFNQVTSSNDPTAHAEVVAIRAACEKLGTFELSGCEIYTSCEPCPMCLSAIYWARLDGIYYGNARDDAANIGFDDEFLYQEVGLPITQRHKPTKQLLADEAIEAFRIWQVKADKVRY